MMSDKFTLKASKKLVKFFMYFSLFGYLKNPHNQRFFDTAVCRIDS